MFPISDYYLPAEMAYRRERLTASITGSRPRTSRVRRHRPRRRHPALRPTFVARRRVA